MSSKKDVKLEWYVLNDCGHFRQPADSPFNNYPYDGGPIKPWNIFNNIHVYEETVKLCKKYKKDKMTFEDFTEELGKVIQWQEWSRCEYEILVGSLFPGKEDKAQKIDCYVQVLPNIKILAKYVLQTYYPRIKITESAPPTLDKIDIATLECL